MNKWMHEQNEGSTERVLLLRFFFLEIGWYPNNDVQNSLPVHPGQCNKWKLWGGKSDKECFADYIM